VLPAERFGPVEKAADSSQSPELRKTAADAAAASADDVSMQVLHVLSQRPSRTGSGITLDALVRHAADDGHEQYVVCGVPADDPEPEIGGLPAERILPLRFEEPLPGMSDVMPYPSTRFSSLSESDVEAYEARWRELLVGLRDRGDIQPDVIHSHHVWLLSALLKDVFPDTPILTHCHATGLRQMELCPHLRERVVTGVGRNERFAALTELHAEKLIDTLDIDSSRVHVVGAGFREDLFRFVARPASRRVVYAGKFADAKGLPSLLDAVENQNLELHVAGAGEEHFVERMRTMPNVVLHGRLDQAGLAEVLQQSDVLVLPSFYEGLPLVLIEALATGCRLVSSALPSVVDSIAPELHGELRLVPMPRLIGPDRPEPEDLPRFVIELREALLSSLAQGPLPEAPDVEHFTWHAVYERVAQIWEQL
jgi:glycosyltransferase involved in cell wall biosynthesis